MVTKKYKILSTYKKEKDMCLESYIEILKSTDLFISFSTDELLSLFKEYHYMIREYKKNTLIYFEGEKCFTFDIILEGEILIQRIDEDGNILTITEFSTSHNVGGNLLFGSNNFYPMSIMTKLNTTILHIQKDFILELCRYSKSFLEEFLKCISDKTFILTNKIKTITMKSLKDSIIDYLNYEYHSQKNTTIQLHMTKKELAERLGVQRTSLSRELNKMKNNGLINYDKDSITIKDIDIIKISNLNQ